MKTLKFRKKLSELILKGGKNATWRLFDDKDLSAGDEVSFVVWETNEEFAKVKIIDVKETTFGELTDEDWKGHEKFNSEKEMYDTYSKYYNREVNKNSPVKIIKFELLR
ncbi:ASCH domain-containing protein [Patescibacteria group bacterium]